MMSRSHILMVFLGAVGYTQAFGRVLVIPSITVFLLTH